LIPFGPCSVLQLPGYWFLDIQLCLQILAVVESLGAVAEDTHAWVEKKLSQNYDELKQDIEREDFDGGGGEDSDDEVWPLSQFFKILRAGNKGLPLSIYAN
jgi:hypothetical protein